MWSLKWKGGEVGGRGGEGGTEGEVEKIGRNSLRWISNVEGGGGDKGEELREIRGGKRRGKIDRGRFGMVVWYSIIAVEF